MSEPTALDDATIKTRLEQELSGWNYDGKWIRRKFKTGGWPHTLMCINALGYLAEAACHHPDLNVSYAFVEIKLATHSAKGITDLDFALARKMEDVLLWHPTPDDQTPFQGYEAMMKKKWTRAE